MNLWRTTTISDERIYSVVSVPLKSPILLHLWRTSEIANKCIASSSTRPHRRRREARTKNTQKQIFCTRELFVVVAADCDRMKSLFTLATVMPAKLPCALISHAYACFRMLTLYWRLRYICLWKAGVRTASGRARVAAGSSLLRIKARSRG